MKKKILYSILTFGLLLFPSFSNAFDLRPFQSDKLDSIALSTGSLNNAVTPVLYENPSPSSSDLKNLCVIFSGFDRSSDFAWNLRIGDSAGYSSNGLWLWGATSPYSMYCISGWRKSLYITVANSSSKIYADYYWVVDGGDLLSYFSDNPDLVEDYNFLSQAYNTLSGSYATCQSSLIDCQSSLSSCQGGQDAAYLQCLEDKEYYQSAYNTLSGQYLSCVNYSSSLSDQLNECLEEISNSSGEMICNTYSLNWYDGNNAFSYQVKNNLRLPRGYKGYLDEGILGIKEINTLENAVSIDDEDFQKVVIAYGVIFLFLFSSSLFLLFLFVIRRYFIGLKS